jgi:hypothetical protein
MEIEVGSKRNTLKQILESLKSKYLLGILHFVTTPEENYLVDISGAVDGTDDSIEFTYKAYRT